MLLKKYEKQVICTSAPRSGNHFIVDLLNTLEIKHYTNIHHYADIMLLNSETLKTITSIRNPLEVIPSQIILRNLMNAKWLDTASHEEIYRYSKDHLENTNIVEEYVRFIELAESTDATVILFENLINHPMQTMIDLNERLDLGLTITDYHIKNEDEIVNVIRQKRGVAEKMDRSYIYVGSYPRGVQETDFYKIIKQVVLETNKCQEAYAMFESYKSRYKF